MWQQKQAYSTSIVCLAASSDALLLEDWERHLLPLKQAELISVWSDLHIHAGASRIQQIESRLNQADLIILLVSAHFFASDECVDLMKQALRRYYRKEARLIPLLLRPVAWRESPLAQLTCIPLNNRFVTQWENQDAAFDECVRAIRSLIGRPITGSLDSFIPTLSRTHLSSPAMMTPVLHTSFIPPSMVKTQPSIQIDRFPEKAIKQTFALPFFCGKAAKRDVYAISLYSLMMILMVILLIFTDPELFQSNVNHAIQPSLYDGVLVFCLIPVGTLLAGITLGSWRSIIAITIYFVAIEPIAPFLHTTPILALFFAGLPLAAGLTGFLYERRSVDGFLSTGIRVFPGAFIMILWLFILAIPISHLPPQYNSFLFTAFVSVILAGVVTIATVIAERFMTAISKIIKKI